MNDIGVTMLELRNVSKRYSGIPVVENVSFLLSAGEILGYLGPNGSGKSTTVKMITGLIQPSSGTILFRGRETKSDLPAFRANLGYVPEEAQIYTHLSGIEYLQLVGRLRGMPEKVIEKRARTLLEILSLESARYSAITDYSKGMKQRVLISAALMHNPQLLIFDEPLSGLDAVSALVFKDLMQILAREGKAILYISHVLEVVERVCDHIMILDHGQVLAYARPKELTSLMQQPDLEGAFARLVQQTDTGRTARELVEVMSGTRD